MDKKGLINKVSEVTGMSKTDVGKVLAAELAVICSEVQADRYVAIGGFGIFQAAHRKARMGRNPKTGESVEIPEKSVPQFKASVAFKNMLTAQETA